MSPLRTSPRSAIIRASSGSSSANSHLSTATGASTNTGPMKIPGGLLVLPTQTDRPFPESRLARNSTPHCPGWHELCTITRVRRAPRYTHASPRRPPRPQWCPGACVVGPCGAAPGVPMRRAAGARVAARIRSDGVALVPLLGVHRLRRADEDCAEQAWTEPKEEPVRTGSPRLDHSQRN